MIITLNQLVQLRRECKQTGKIVVLTSGSFDILHMDHICYLQSARKLGDVLVVAVKSDAAVRLKGANRPVNPDVQRAFVIDNIKGVDYTVIVPYDASMTTTIEADNLEQQQWLTMFEPIVQKLVPDVWCHEEAPKLQTARQRLFAKYGVSGVPQPRGNNNSTTQILNKMKGIK